MSDRRAERIAEAARIKRIGYGLRCGYTRAYSEKNQEDRRAWIMEMIGEGWDDAEIQAATGLPKSAVYDRRRRAAEDGEESEAKACLDTGAYMQSVRRLGAAPPESWKFGRDLRPLPSRPVAIRSTTFAGRCVDEGDPHTAPSDL